MRNLWFVLFDSSSEDKEKQTGKKQLSLIFSLRKMFPSAPPNVFIDVADTMLRRPEPTKERVEPTTLGITAIMEFSHSTRVPLPLLLRTQRFMANHDAAQMFFNPSKSYYCLYGYQRA